MLDRGEASSRFPWPPTIYAIATLAAIALGWLFPVALFPDSLALLPRIVGGVVIVGAVALVILAEREFRRAGTPALPTAPTRAIVSSGVFGFTRNPMYLGFTAALIGVALAANSLWFLIAVPFAVFAVTKLAIEREERYLSRKFGEEYRAYRARVRRWL
jgi:protein-S-isoprenylcysteine O-methyltransferase Ste14